MFKEEITERERKSGKREAEKRNKKNVETMENFCLKKQIVQKVKEQVLKLEKRQRDKLVDKFWMKRYCWYIYIYIKYGYKKVQFNIMK